MKTKKNFKGGKEYKCKSEITMTNNSSRNGSNSLNTSFQPTKMPDLGQLIKNNSLDKSKLAIASASSPEERNEAVQKALPNIDINSLKKSMPANLGSLAQGAMSNPAVQQQVMQQAAPIAKKIAPLAGIAGTAAKALGVPANQVNMAQKMVKEAAKGGFKSKRNKKKKLNKKKRKLSRKKRRY